MSGSTTVTGGGRWWSATLSTPRVSFPVPAPGETSAEQAYHSEHADRFHAQLARAREPLDTWLASVATEFDLVPMDADGVDVALPTADPRGPRWVAMGGGLKVRARRPLPPDDASRLGFETLRRLDRLERRPAPLNPLEWHMVRWPDGTVVDRDGDPPGWVAPRDLPADAGAELAHRIADLVAGCESLGAYVGPLGPQRVYLDDDGTVALTGFGTVRERESTPLPWGDPSPSDALDVWLRDRFGTPLPHSDREATPRLDERVAAGAHGIYRPCRSCVRPCLLGTVGARFEDDTWRPNCDPCVRRADRLDTALMVGALVLLPIGFVAAVGALAWWLT